MTFSPQLEAKFEKLVGSYPEGRQRAALIPMLLFTQDEVGALDQEVVEEIASRLGLTALDVDQVITYYSMLSKKPRGKYHVQICTNVSCLLLGADQILERAKKRLGLENGEVTPDGQFSLEEVECLGACSWGPAIEVNYEYHHHMTPEKVEALIAELRKLQ